MSPLDRMKEINLEENIMSGMQKKRENISNLSSDNLVQEFNDIKSIPDKVEFLSEVCITACNSGLQTQENRDKLTIASRLAAQTELKAPGFKTDFYMSLMGKNEKDVLQSCHNTTMSDLIFCQEMGCKMSKLPLTKPLHDIE